MVNFNAGQLIKGAYVLIDGVEYEVHMPQYSGDTPLTPENLNKMQEDLQKDIVESEENGNSAYVKFADGTMICTGKMNERNVSFEFSVGSGLYRCQLRQFSNFLKSFIGDVNDVKVSIEINNISEEVPCWICRYGSGTGMYKPNLNNAGKFSIIKPSSANSDILVSYIAVGKWK